MNSIALSIQYSYQFFYIIFKAEMDTLKSPFKILCPQKPMTEVYVLFLGKWRGLIVRWWIIFWSSLSNVVTLDDSTSTLWVGVFIHSHLLNIFVKIFCLVTYNWQKYFIFICHWNFQWFNNYLHLKSEKIEMASPS